MNEKKLTEEHRIERVDASKWRSGDLRRFLDEIDSDAQCGKCGGLPYDIVFSHKGLQYKFCLYKVQKDGVILAETDYEKLHEYTRKGGPMMRQRAHVTV
jgi:hypothetical protein